ncbi:hypothetical protein CXF85_21300 [Colwellia sp. 75C3]|uniref:hypothetical protein n=1 Tax=Colwellia sp. 75C3 TaxID=888425 RepID=UPI000C31E657|nr:hypothetical protein [Colwellia sp. 75C3]PKG80660.1 hypothetical protein CXF85_21300 [Colwellia sp. 75C3]
MSNSTIEAEISFRFLSLDKFQAYSLVREILGATHKEEAESNRYIASVPLTKQNLEDINDYYVRQRVEVEACDIFVSVNTEATTCSIAVPAIVNRMLKYIDCKLTFSYTVI